MGWGEVPEAKRGRGVGGDLDSIFLSIILSSLFLMCVFLCFSACFVVVLSFARRYYCIAKRRIFAGLALERLIESCLYRLIEGYFVFLDCGFIGLFLTNRWLF
mgnify:CR=1 FL=1|jgi:hypothetical protein